MTRLFSFASRCRLPLFLLAASLLVVGCEDEEQVTTGGGTSVTDDLVAEYGLEVLPPTPYPTDDPSTANDEANPPIQERISLGWLMFFDPIMGGEMDAACGTCHHPDFGFADGRQFGAGTSGSGLGPHRILSSTRSAGLPIELEPRNTPSIWNTAFNLDETGILNDKGFQFMDGRVRGLEQQAKKPITSRVEMRGDAYGLDDVAAGAAALDSVINRLRAIPEYVTLFQAAFPADMASKPGALIIDTLNYGRAIAAFEREIQARNTPYDRFVMGDANALNTTEKEGLILFFEKAQCAQCHSGPQFSDFSFVVQGVPQEGNGKGVIPGDDTGRREHTKNVADNYAFRTLGLRNIVQTAPYMHAGNFETLEEVVRFYNDGCQPRHAPVTDAMLDARLHVNDDVAQPVETLGLTDDEVNAVVAFMKALTDNGTTLTPFLMTVPQVVPSGLTPVFGLNAGGSGKPQTETTYNQK